jgi:hypothetical protein
MGDWGELTGAGAGVSASCSGDKWLNAVAMLEMSSASGTEVESGVVAATRRRWRRVGG